MTNETIHDDYKPFLTSIKKYIDLESTDYALQLDGEWGTGKTYFVKNILAKELENRGKELIYVSLNGVDSIAKISEHIAMEVLYPKLSRILPFLDGLARYTGAISGLPIISPLIKEVTNDLKKDRTSPDSFKECVLCFDDLERIVAKDDSFLEEVLGYINSQFVEHNQTKVLIVSNENQLTEKYPSFPKIKEKLIGRRIKFQLSLELTFENFVKGRFSSINHLETFFNRQKNSLIPYMNQVSSIHNFRTLRNALDLFSNVLLECSALISDASIRNTLNLSLFLNIWIISRERDRGGFDRDTLTKLYGTEKPNRWAMSNKNDENNIDEFLNTYHFLLSDGNIHLMYLSSITNYVLDGHLDIDLLTIELLEQKEYLSGFGNAEKEASVILNQFKMPFVLENEAAVKHSQEEMIRLLKNNQIPLPSYIGIYRDAVALEKMNLWFVSLDDFTSALKSNFKKALDKWNPPMNELNKYLYGNIFEIKDPLIQNWSNQISQKINEIKTKHKAEILSNWMNQLDQRYNKYTEKVSALDVIYLLVHGQLIDQLLSLSNPALFSFLSFITNAGIKEKSIEQGRRISQGCRIKQSRTFVLRIKDILKNEGIDQLRRYHLQEISSQIVSQFKKRQRVEPSSQFKKLIEVENKIKEITTKRNADTIRNQQTTEAIELLEKIEGINNKIDKESI